MQRRRFRFAGVVALFLATGFLAPGAAGAQPGSDVIEVTLHPEPGTEFIVGSRTYGGTLEIAWHRDGLAVVESLAIDDYLAGIREVPLSWPMEALKAQAVAARTYLAWTLDRGRSSDGRTYDFDICATTQCQVYAGTGVVRQADGGRWLGAIAETSNEILLYEGAPAQTLYSSSAGSRTRSVQDIWPGTGKPYLTAVDSPEAGVTPYESWRITLEVEVLRRIFAAAGITIGSEISAVEVNRQPDGAGPSSLVIDSEIGRVSVPATTVRTRINQYGPLLYPGVLPANRPSGTPWPQAFLSYTFDVEWTPGPAAGFPSALPSEDLPSRGSVTFVGEGWGHGVGMSQWGAKAMADDGVDYHRILSHYYTGLAPRDGTGVLPDQVAVGLGWGWSFATVAATGPFELRINGVPAGEYGVGAWSFRNAGDGIAVLSPDELRDATRWIGARPWPR